MGRRIISPPSPYHTIIHCYNLIPNISLCHNMSCISVVRLGPNEDNVSAGMLRNAVLDFFAKKQGKDALLSNDTFAVTNKYFDAQIKIQEIHDDTTHGESEIPYKEDGIILVFDAAKSNPDLHVDAAASFGSLGMVHDKAVEMGGGDLLRLCIGVTIGSKDAFELRGQAYEKEYARRINWCLDRGYEYVECDLSQEAILQGHDERDKEGFARVVEAIAGTMWSSAVMNKTKKKTVVEEESAPDPESEYVPPDPTMLMETDEERVEQARRAILEQSGIQNEGEAVLGQENVNPGRSHQQSEREQEKVFDNLESALRQAASIREMSRSGELSDDDRRKRAGDAADLLMTLMQQVGMDDDDTDEEPVESTS